MIFSYKKDDGQTIIFNNFVRITKDNNNALAYCLYNDADSNLNLESEPVSIKDEKGFSEMMHYLYNEYGSSMKESLDIALKIIHNDNKYFLNSKIKEFLKSFENVHGSYHTIRFYIPFIPYLEDGTIIEFYNSMIIYDKALLSATPDYLLYSMVSASSCNSNKYDAIMEYLKDSGDSTFYNVISTNLAYILSGNPDKSMLSENFIIKVMKDLYDNDAKYIIEQAMDMVLNNDDIKRIDAGFFNNTDIKEIDEIHETIINIFMDNLDYYIDGGDVNKKAIIAKFLTDMVDDLLDNLNDVIDNKNKDEVTCIDNTIYNLNSEVCRNLIIIINHLITTMSYFMNTKDYNSDKLFALNKKYQIVIDYNNPAIDKKRNNSGVFIPLDMIK